ncbi:hypothetical protein K435DRAFT_857499 [Dendrothele bispora CBS 962.96]|uniref:Uncharacterized protein n=1 Tax=Dendrothele bispora (strain CBS 962.96) TaxID=1314807 RepID=A0A4S8M700_DENBC|nr:hypothetical protein K435DRAFT_857499 [Dendrothele bispora CBS 962.96]
MTSNIQRSMIVAIVLYAQKDRLGRPINPHWTITTHKNGLWQDNTQIYQITQTTTPEGWKLDYKRCSRYNAGSSASFKSALSTSADSIWIVMLIFKPRTWTETIRAG